METIKVKYFESIMGMYVGIVDLPVHAQEKCMGQDLFCSVHNPSDHPLRDAQRSWRADKGMMERECAHGIGHPDPDDLAFKQAYMDPNRHKQYAFGWHGCDGCC